MFKVFKYLLLANLYKRAKKSILSLIILIFSLIFFVLIINDLLGVVDEMSIYILGVKWVVIFTLITLIVRTFLKIIYIEISVFNRDNALTSNIELEDSKREYILNKERLFSKNETILKKYMKEQ